MFRAARDRMTAEPEVATGIRLAVIDGFTEFTTPQLMMLRLLAERAERVVVTLAGEAGRGSGGICFARTIATRRLLVEELGAEIQWEGEAPAEPPLELEAQNATSAKNATKSQGKREAEPSGGSAGSLALPGVARDGALRGGICFGAIGSLSRWPTLTLESLDRWRSSPASSVHAEIEEIARRVKSLLVDGEAPSDVLVAFRSTFDVADRVRQAL